MEEIKVITEREKVDANLKIATLNREAVADQLSIARTNLEAIKVQHDSKPPVDTISLDLVTIKNSLSDVESNLFSAIQDSERTLLAEFTPLNKTLVDNIAPAVSSFSTISHILDIIQKTLFYVVGGVCLNLIVLLINFICR